MFLQKPFHKSAMRLNNATILITGEIDKSLIREMIANEVDVDVIPFIQTKILRTKKIHQQVEKIFQLNAIAVFTSVHAIEAISEHLQTKKPDWNIYCIGNSTKLLAEKYFGKTLISAIADDATSLAKKIIAEKLLIKEVYFFCGDKKRNELPGLLNENNIVVHEIEVYSTIILEPKLQKKYDAVLFFSPSAVEGFFKNNTVQHKTFLFAIGNTTANEIRKFTKNEIVIGYKPGKKELINKALAYLKR